MGPTTAALVIEALLLGAGGILFVDYPFSRVLVSIVHEHRSSSPSLGSGTPEIFAEVFVWQRTASA